MDVSFSLSLCLSLFFFFFICMHHCPVLHYCLPTNPTSNIFKDGLIVEWNKNNLKDNKKQIGEKKELLGSKALTWYYKLCTLSSLALTSSCIKLGSFSSQTKLKKKKKKGFCVYVGTCFRGKKIRTLWANWLCNGSTRVYYSEQHSIKCGPYEQRVMLANHPGGFFFCVWVVSICQLSVPVRDIQSCHFLSASICEAFCSCYTTHTVLIEGQQGVLEKILLGRVKRGREMSGPL